MFAVVACSGCRSPWAVDLRHATSTCPRCQASVELADRRKLWQGEDGMAAQAAAAEQAAVLQGGSQGVHAIQALRQRPEARHDSPADAAAAQAAGIVNASARAEAVALWMTRLCGLVEHDALLNAMGKAGIPAARAEKEVIRLLATDLMMEPRAGFYQVL